VLVLEVLVEEPSSESACETLIPRIEPRHRLDETFRVRAFNGKADLLRKLPARLKGYAASAYIADVTMLVVVDRDDDDCVDLKRSIERMVVEAGLLPLGSRRAASAGCVKVRVACEELEAWYIGDPAALRSAYPRLPKAFENRAVFRSPDGVNGGTWERLERLLQTSGYFPGGLRKLQLTRAVAKFMDPKRNTSPSFQSFCDAVRQLSAFD